ncbi:MAG: copper homeostasis protein CutC [Candidatus Symbiothrix sp.]|jgi:copper homeostasis protein|nr:copper homeostasis protein CutC [Candidatus Symbiothrix sp.]
MKLEVCIDSLQGAVIAQSSGAYRVELCAGLPEGGTTPSSGLIQKVCQVAENLKVYVLIRPRGGDFLYSDDEFEIMQADVRYCGTAGCDGVVMGMLNADGTVDKNRCRELVKIAKEYGMGVTFHRAFDRSNDLFQALEDVIETGCERILTSGGYDNVIEGKEVLRRLIEKAGQRIIIMPGAGVTPANAKELIQYTGLQELHGTFRTVYTGNMQYKNPHLSHPEQEYSFWMTDAEKIKKIIHL